MRPATPGRPLATSPWSRSPRTDFRAQQTSRPLYIPDAEDLLGIRESERKEALVRAAEQRPSSAAKRIEDAHEPQGENQVVGMTREFLNNKFKHMRDAFRKLDLDNSMTLTSSEIKKAMVQMNIPVTDESLSSLIQALDKNGDDAISYDEFVKVLARDTVAVSALSKVGARGTLDGS